MASVPLRDVVNTAHGALESGDYGVARAACQQVLTHYPHFADMHRLHGEIALEQGETNQARQSFEKALSYDPQNVLATLGLGVIAEESLDLQAAAQYFQRALEIDPSLTQLRDELVRLYSKLYGQGGRLRVSGAGLAAIYARGNQLSLARRQYEQTLGQVPDRLDLVLALAEVCWRQHDLGLAQEYCQRVLTVRPQTVRGLYIQADIARQQGDMAQARQHATQAVALDPLGDIARQLEHLNPVADLASLSGTPSMIAAFDPTAASATLPHPGVSQGAPTGGEVGGEDREWKKLTSELDAGALPAGSLDEIDDGLNITWPWEQEDTVQQVEPMTAMAETAPATPAPPALDDGAAPPALETVAGELATEVPPLMAPGDWSMADWDTMDQAIDAARPENMPRGYTTTLREIEDLGFEPFDFETPSFDPKLPEDLTTINMPRTATPPSTSPPPSEPASPVAPPPAAAEAVSAAEPDAELALQELIVGRWDTIDQELAAATPSESSSELEALAAQLAPDGIVPFAAEPDSSAAPSLTDGWDEIDRSLAAATPGSSIPRGFTQELNALQGEGLAPFNFEDLDAGLEPLVAGDPAEPSPAEASPAEASPVEASPTAPPPTAAPTPPADLPPMPGIQLDANLLQRALETAPTAPLSWPAHAPAPLAASDEPPVELSWADLQAEFAGAVPATGSLPTGFTSDLKEIEAQGLTPFDSPPAEASVPAPPPPVAADLVAPPVPVAPPPAPAAPLDLPVESGPHPLLSLEDEIAAAIPSSENLPRGFTADLRELTDQGLAPFVLDGTGNSGQLAPPAPLPSSLAAPIVPPPTAPPPVAPPVAPPATQSAPAAGRPRLPSIAPATQPSQPAETGLALGLAGPIFNSMRARKAELITSGRLKLRHVTPAAAPPVTAPAAPVARVEEPEPTTADERLAFAAQQVAAGKIDEAARHYRWLLRAEPDRLATLAPLIETLATNHRHEPLVARLLGELYLRQGRYSQAISIYRSLLVATTGA